MLDAIRTGLDSYRAGRVMSKSRYSMQIGNVSPGVFEYWQRTAHLEFEGIPKDKVFFAQALEGLLDFFACVRDSGKPCGLPSAAADSVWHAWAARAPANLERFCVRHFGRAIPHIEEADMKPQMDSALATCMVHARRLEKRDPIRPSVPALFALDRKLRMPRGYSYDLKDGAVTLQRLNAHGLPEGWRRYQGGLECVQLLSAGLISQQAYETYEKQQRQVGAACGSGSSSGGSCGSSSSNSSSASCNSTDAGCADSGGGDSGGDGGGGGCGGGCGGGGGCGS